MREIEAFLAVAEELHFGRAAQRLHLTTGSVSQAIRALERRVGVPLFERTSRQVALTPVGADLLTRVRPAYEELADALRQAQRAGRLRHRDALRIGFASSLPPDMASRLLDAFGQDAPDCLPIRIDYPAMDLLQWFETGQFAVQVCVAWIPAPDASPRPVPDWVAIGPALFTRPRAALMSTRHPLAAKPSVDIEELSGYEVLRPWGFRGFAEAWIPATTPGGQPVRQVQQTRLTYLEDMPGLLRDGSLIHLTADGAAGQFAAAYPELALVPVTGLPPVGCVTLWPKTGENQLIRSFAESAAAEYAGDRAVPLNARY